MDDIEILISKIHDLIEEHIEHNWSALEDEHNKMQTNYFLGRLFQSQDFKKDVEKIVEDFLGGE